MNLTLNLEGRFIKRLQFISLAVFLLLQLIIVLLFCPDTPSASDFRGRPVLQFLLNTAGRLYNVELEGYDTLLRAIPHVKPDGRVCPVVVNDECVKFFFGAWPWSREIHAQMIERLQACQVAAVGMDFLFASASSNDGDTHFARALARFKNAVLACKIPGSVLDPVVAPLPAFLEGASTGFIQLDDQQAVRYTFKLRRMDLVCPVEAERVSQFGGSQNLIHGDDGTLYCPCLAFATWLKAMNYPLSAVKVTDHSVSVADTVIPTNDNHQIMIDYIHLLREGGQLINPFAGIPYWRMLGKVPPPEAAASLKSATLPPPTKDMKGRIVLIGPDAPDMLGDVVDTPYGPLPGIYVHANILNTLLTRTWIREEPRWCYLALIVLPSTILALLLLRLRAGHALLLSLLAVVAFVFTSKLALQHGLWIPYVAPCLSMAMSAGLVMLYQFLRGYNLLKEFVTPEVAHSLLLAGGAVRQTRERECTIVFSDIRDFSAMSEDLPPMKLVELLTEYHRLTVPIYERHGGRCLDYLGDAQMVVFGDPIMERAVRVKNHAVAALQAGLEVQSAVELMNQRRKASGLPVFEVGIGCCTGIVAVGVLGADEKHLQYSVIGDVTNTASRIQGLSRELDAPLIAAQSTVTRAGEEVTATLIKSVRLKGKSHAVDVYRVTAVRA